MSLNLAVVTTLGSNSGDNFIYEGFKNLFPIECYGSMFLIDKTEIPRDNSYRELIDESDLIVVCGSPIFYQDCYRMKWQNRILEYSKKSGKKILLLAVGSNFKCSADGIVIFPDTARDSNYADFVARYEEALIGNFTVRDRYCSEFLKSTGASNIRRIVCPSLFASNGDIVRNAHDLIFIIWGGIHWNCEVPKEQILEICKKVQSVLAVKFKDKRVVWVCHDFDSYRDLLRHIARHDILFSNNYADFFKYYSRCYFAFSVKVHGSMLLASMGTPSCLLQLDSRAAVIEALDEDYATPSTPADQLIGMCVEKIRNANEYKDKISNLKSKYRENYRDLFGSLGLI